MSESPARHKRIQARGVRTIATPRAACLLSMFIAAIGNAASSPAQKDEEPPEVRFAAMLEAEYGPLGTTTDQILARESTHEPTTIVGALVYRLRAKPAARLSSIERKLLAVADLRDEVNNGGFHQYFSNAAGDRYALALQAFREMGATALTKVLQRALTVFPGAKPSTSFDVRQRAIAGAAKRAEAVWGACDDEFYLRDEGYAALALAYAKKYRAQIILP
jgi:hypothetical protein